RPATQNTTSVTVVRRSAPAAAARRPGARKRAVDTARSRPSAPTTTPHVTSAPRQLNAWTVWTPAASTAKPAQAIARRAPRGAAPPRAHRASRRLAPGAPNAGCAGTRKDAMAPADDRRAQAARVSRESAAEREGGQHAERAHDDRHEHGARRQRPPRPQ